MKHIFLIIASFFCLTLSAQTDTVTLAVNDDVTWNYGTARTWIITLDRDTITDEDTLFVDGDTILTGVDTIQIDLPNNLTDAYAGMLVLNTDTIVGYTGATGNYRLFQAACETCDYVPIIASTAITTPAQLTKQFDLHMIRLRLVIWTTGDTGQVWGNLVLKPSSISSD